MIRLSLSMHRSQLHPMPLTTGRFVKGQSVTSWPNKSPEPTAAGVWFCFSDTLSPPWLSFLR